MYVSYMDEAGHFNDPNCKYVGMAGFVAPEEFWEPFGKLWNNILRSEPFNLTQPFHTKDFAGKRGEFVGWSEEKRQNLYGQLIEAILLIQPIPIATLISIDDFKSLSDHQQVSFKGPYHLCFQTCTRGAAIMGMDGPKTRMIFAQNLEYGAIQSEPNADDQQLGNAELLWHSIKRLTDFGVGMESCSFKTPAEAIPLQAADLFAYELCKEFENQQKRPGDVMRWAMRQILSLYPGEEVMMIRLFDRKELLRLIVEAGMPHREGTEEIVHPDIQMARALEARVNWVKIRIAQHDAKRKK